VNGYPSHLRCGNRTSKSTITVELGIECMTDQRGDLELVLFCIKTSIRNFFSNLSFNDHNFHNKHFHKSIFSIVQHVEDISFVGVPSMSWIRVICVTAVVPHGSLMCSQDEHRNCSASHIFCVYHYFASTRVKCM